MDIRNQGLRPEPFAPPFGMTDEALAQRAVLRFVAEPAPACLDRGRTSRCRRWTISKARRCLAFGVVTMSKL